MGEIGKLLKEIEEAEKDEPKLTLAVIRKKYKGKKIDLSKLPKFECSFTEKTMELDWEFTDLRDWSGEETAYNVTIQLNPDMTIKQISALHCRRYTGSDATADGYRNKRAEDFDYWLLEKRIISVLKER
jgi:hypothetical protein